MPPISPSHSAIAICTAGSGRAAVALAACAFALPTGADGDTQRIQLMPAGAFSPSDGRDELPQSGHWFIDQAVASKVIARFAARKNPAVLDYEHQTLRREQNGQPAPAAGWIGALEWVDGQGLYGVTQLTARAQGLIDAHEYQFVSPVFSYDRVTGEVLDVRMAAITNDPAIDGMEPLARQAAATFGITLEEKHPMNLLTTILALLALPESTPETDAVAALTARLKTTPLDDGKLRTALGIGNGDDVVAACTSLRQRADAAAPDPSKFVAVGVVEDLKTQLAALTARQVDKDVDELVQAGLADGRLLAAQAAWARDLGKSNLASLTAYLEKAVPIAALSSMQTQGRIPANKTVDGLTADEVAVCTAAGIDPKDFIAARP